MFSVHYQHHLYCTVTTTKTVDREFNSEKVLKTSRQKPTKYYTGLQMYYGPYLQNLYCSNQIFSSKTVVLKSSSTFRMGLYTPTLFIYLFIYLWLSRGVINSAER
jgi:hypothetical protein